MSRVRAVLPAVMLCVATVALPFATHAAVRDAEVQEMRDASPETAPAVPIKPRRMLVFNLCHGFRHGSIPYVAKALDVMGEKTGAYATVVSDDPEMLRSESLMQFDAVCMNNNTTRVKGVFEDEYLRQSLLDFVRDGGGLVGIHAATDCFYQWPEYGEMMGGYFWGHPWHENVAVKIEEPDHPVCAPFEEPVFEVTDEIYQFRDPYSREKLRVLLSLDTDKINMEKRGIRRKDRDFAVSWVRSYGKGRVFYCSLGHRNEITWNPTVLRHYLAGIQFALGDLPAPTAPSAMERPASIGDWEGVRTAADGARSRMVAQVIARANDRYEVNLLPEFETREPEIAVLEGKEEGGKVALEGKHGDTTWRGTMGNDTFSGRFEGETSGNFTLRRVARLSPTLGAEPPKGATVLFDGSGAENWRQNWGGGGGAGWKFVDGAMEVVPGGGSAVSKQQFGDHKIHVEFWLPLQPGARGQGRANSGVYVQRRFEVQVLDSYGLEGKSNECGGIYKVAAPRVNACAPPEQWQTYDITFRAARFDDEGNLTRAPRMTVYHNGVLIHDNVELAGGTGGGKGGIPREGPILLQDHGNPVRYRNIWVQPLD